MGTGQRGQFRIGQSQDITQCSGGPGGCRHWPQDTSLVQDLGYFANPAHSQLHSTPTLCLCWLKCLSFLSVEQIESGFMNC